MKAAIVKKQGMFPVIEEIDNPTLVSEDDLLLTVKASALTMVSKGFSLGSHYSSQDVFPKVAGMEGIGEATTGERFYFNGSKSSYGALAEQTLVDKRRAVEVPTELDTITAAAIANPGMSSYAALVHRAKITKNDVVLVNGATGTAGTLAVKMAYALGAKKVIALGRDNEALELAGADAYLSTNDYQDKEQSQYIADLGDIISDVTIVLDYLWGKPAEQIMRALYQFSNRRTEIRYVQIGTLASPTIDIPGALLRSTKFTLLGSGFGSLSANELVSSIQHVFALAVQNKWTVPTVSFDLNHIQDAWDAPSHPRSIIII